MPIRAGILLTHPTQYHSAWFKELAGRGEIEIKVFYCFQPRPEEQGIGFGRPFQWDIPLLDGYEYAFLHNQARRQGFHFSGCHSPEIAEIISARGFDAWIINGWKVRSDWQAIKACCRNRVPALIRGDSHLLDPKPPHVRVAKRLLLGRWIPRFSRYLTVGKLNEDFYRFYGADPARFFPVRHCVDNERFAAGASEHRQRRQELRNRWAIPNDAIIFLFAGKFIPKKRPLLAIKGLERLTHQGINARLLMVGDGELKQTCEDYVREKRLPVSFAGFLNQSEIAQAYACANVLLMPSAVSETWGLVVNEAMSCGLPAIVSDRVGCGPDLVQPGKTGFVFHNEDEADLARAMEIYARDITFAALHGANARQLVAHYGIKEAADNTVAALLSLS